MIRVRLIRIEGGIVKLPWRNEVIHHLGSRQRRTTIYEARRGCDVLSIPSVDVRGLSLDKWCIVPMKHYYSADDVLSESAYRGVINPV